MTDFEFVSIVVAAASAAAAFASAAAASAAAAGIWRGIRAMVRANKERAVVLDQQRQADERRHTEAMTALDELIRTGQRQAAALDESIRASQRQTAALDELLRRTGGPQPAN